MREGEERKEGEARKRGEDEVEARREGKGRHALKRAASSGEDGNAIVGSQVG